MYKRFGIINLSSIASTVDGLPTMSQYSGTKRYDETFTKLTKEYLQKTNVDTLLLQPGCVTTSMTNYIQNDVMCSFCIPEQTSRSSLC